MSKDQSTLTQLENLLGHSIAPLSHGAINGESPFLGEGLLGYYANEREEVIASLGDYSALKKSWRN